MTAPRLHITAEGQTEERYANRVLVPHLGNNHQVVTDVRAVKTGRKRGADYRGGLLTYETAKLDLLAWIKEEREDPDTWFTTMFDFYALPDDFPGLAEARKRRDVYERVEVLEEALRQDLGCPRLMPYIQLHEFEALILANPRKLEMEYLNHAAAIARLVALSSQQNPEEIDDGKETAPSKRIIAEIREYAKQKAVVGPAVVEGIGLPLLRRRCRHFNEWLLKLEGLAHLPE